MIPRSVLYPPILAGAAAYAFTLVVGPFLPVRGDGGEDGAHPHHNIPLGVVYATAAMVSTSGTAPQFTVTGPGAWQHLATADTTTGAEVTTVHAGREHAAKPSKPAFVSPQGVR